MPVLEEALYFRIPLVCSRIGHIPEMVSDAALLVDPVEPGELAAAIQSIWGDKGIANELARRAVARSWEWDWNEVARDFRARYRYGGRPCAS
jgi:glycosyltransferase involved in cell wall biosynthesis